ASPARRWTTSSGTPSATGASTDVARREANQVYGALVDRLIDAVNADPRVRALWLEGPAMAGLRRPYRQLEVHLACDEPDCAAVLGGLEALVAGPGTLGGAAWSEVPRFARELRGSLEASRWRSCSRRRLSSPSGRGRRCCPWSTGPVTSATSW